MRSKIDPISAVLVIVWAIVFITYAGSLIVVLLRGGEVPPW